MIPDTTERRLVSATRTPGSRRSTGTRCSPPARHPQAETKPPQSIRSRPTLCMCARERTPAARGSSRSGGQPGHRFGHRPVLTRSMTRDRQGHTLSSVAMTSANVDSARVRHLDSRCWTGRHLQRESPRSRSLPPADPCSRPVAPARHHRRHVQPPTAGARVGVGRSMTVRWHSFDADGGPVGKDGAWSW